MRDTTLESTPTPISEILIFCDNFYFEKKEDNSLGLFINTNRKII